MFFKDIIKRKCISSVDNEVAATTYLERICPDKALPYHWGGLSIDMHCSGESREWVRKTRNERRFLSTCNQLSISCYSTNVYVFGSIQSSSFGTQLNSIWFKVNLLTFAVLKLIISILRFESKWSKPSRQPHFWPLQIVLPCIAASPRLPSLDRR